MKRIKLLHNEGAGNADHTKEELVRLLETHRFICEYSSTKKRKWKELAPHIDFIAVAGGDGTIRKVSGLLLSHTRLEKEYKLGVIPLGTANNICAALRISGDPAEVVARWQNQEHKSYDVGRINGIKPVGFFLESFGYGIFPYLMQVMSKSPLPESLPTDEQLVKVLQRLHKICKKYAPRFCSLYIDGVDYSGEYILAEIMNTPGIGPNLVLSPGSDPGDGWLEVVLVKGADKERFTSYVKEKMEGKEPVYDFKPIRAKEVNISWDGKHVHVDDEILKLKKNERISVELRPGVLAFLV